VPNKVETKFDYYIAISNNIDNRHKWHSFPAKYPPGLPYEFIEKYTSEDDIVFDPMSGSGTTLIEAQRLNRKSIGADVDPLSIINLNGKFSISDPQIIDSAYYQLIANTRTLLSNGSDIISNTIDKRFSNKTKEFIYYWFPDNSIAQLTALSDQILDLSDASVRDFFLMVLSATIITKHGNVCYAADLAHTRPHKVIGKKIKEPLDEFEKKYRSIIKDQANHFLLNKSNRPLVCYGDARFMDIDANSVDLIVTSPPYANNAIDYLRAHKFALIWMGYSIEQVSKIRQSMVGEVSGSLDYQILPEKTRLIVEMIKQSNKSKGNRLEKYYKDMSQMLRKISEVLKPNKHAIIVVASSVIDGIDVITHECIIDIAQQTNLCLVKMQTRDIDRNKRMMPVSNVINKNSQIETRMHVEYVIDFKKV
jgi:DNA modification methylase